MTKLTNEQIQSILDGAPDWARYFDETFSSYSVVGVRCLEDIRENLSLRQEVSDLNEENGKLKSDYGDSWYDGFMAAVSRECNTDSESILDLSESEIRTMSEITEEYREKWERE